MKNRNRWCNVGRLSFVRHNEKYCAQRYKFSLYNGYGPTLSLGFFEFRWRMKNEIT